MKANVERADVEPLRHRILGPIGKGGMASVHLALCRGANEFQRLAVVKKLHTELRNDASLRKMFRDEGRLGARLNHPNVIQTYELAQLDGQDIIVMEYLEGQPLSRLMTLCRTLKRVMPPRFAARILSDALAGLDYVHRCKDFDGRPLGVVHRDMSPQNLFITYEGNVKLVDFGVAKAALAHRAVTRVGSVKGKLAYMAPEQVNGEAVDPRTDVFAAGVVLWELVTSERLIGNRTTGESLRMIVKGDFPVLHEMRDDVPVELSNIVARALERKPSNRFESASAMREALEAFLAASGPPLRSEDLAAVMNEAFAAQRLRRQRHVRRWLSDTSAPGAQQLLGEQLGDDDGEAASAPGEIRPAESTPAENTPAEPTAAEASAEQVDESAFSSRGQLPSVPTLLATEAPALPRRSSARRIGPAVLGAIMSLAFGAWLAASQSGEGAQEVNAGLPPASETAHVDVDPLPATSEVPGAAPSREEVATPSTQDGDGAEVPQRTKPYTQRTNRRVARPPRPRLPTAEEAKTAEPKRTAPPTRAPLLPQSAGRAPLLADSPGASKAPPIKLELLPARTENSP